MPDFKQNFKASSFWLRFCRTKCAVKPWKSEKGDRERSDKNYCLNGFLKGQLQDSKAKTRGTALNHLKVLWELLCYWHTWPSKFLLVLSMKCLIRKYLLFFEVEILSDKFFIMRISIEFHEYILVALILKLPYFWVRKVGMLRWSFKDQQVSYVCRFADNVNRS